MAGLSPFLVFPVASGWILQLSVQCHFNLGAWEGISLYSLSVLSGVECAVGAQALAWIEAEKVTDLQAVESVESSSDMKQEVMHSLQLLLQCFEVHHQDGASVAMRVSCSHNECCLSMDEAQAGDALSVLVPGMQG